MTPDARAARAQRWKAFYEEPGGLGEMLDHMRATHLTALTLTEPWDTDRLKKVGLSMAMVNQLEQTVRGVIGDGALARHAIKHAERIQSIPERKRRWL